MTTEQILAEIYKNHCEDEIFCELSRQMIQDKKDMKHTIADQKATLRIIGKVTKDQTVKNILAED